MTLTKREREDLAAWCEAVNERAQEWADRIDPKRTGKGDLVRKLDRLATAARDAAGYAK